MQHAVNKKDFGSVPAFAHRACGLPSGRLLGEEVVAHLSNISNIKETGVVMESLDFLEKVWYCVRYYHTMFRKVVRT